ncbi:MAG TPA: pseudouridine synthase [Longimicrobium sp.]|nr:pseudouridine synthase [Longimicrobium sp.]
MEEVRLQAFLAHSGVASRRAAEELIASGRVFVNGESVTAPGLKVRPGVDEISVEGQTVAVQPITWIALHKPTGYVTTRIDQYGRKTIYDLLPDRYHGLFHVGRLDRDSEGLILLTNDGGLANRMLHPSFGVTKEYWADVEGKPTAEEMHRLTDGVEHEGEILKAESVRRLHQTGEHEHRLSIVMVEGKNREVRRMLEALGHPVNRLMRRRFGPVALGELKPGKWRVVDDTELSSLRKKPEKAAEATATGTGGDRPPRRATHGTYSDAEKKPARPASAEKSRRNADEKGSRPLAKVRKPSGQGAAKPARGRWNEDRDATPRAAGESGKRAGKRGPGEPRERFLRPSARPTGKPVRRDAEETPRGPVRRDDDAPRRPPVRRDDDAPRSRPSARDGAPRRAPVRRDEASAPRRPSAGSRPGAPARPPRDGDDTQARRPPAGRSTGPGRPRRDDEETPTRRPTAGRSAAPGRPRRDDDEGSTRRPTAGRGAGPGRPRRDDEEAPTRRPPAGRSAGPGRPRRDDEEAPTRRPPAGRSAGPSRPRRDDDEGPTRRPTAGRSAGPGRPRRDDDEGPTRRPPAGRGAGPKRPAKSDDAREERRPGQGGEREMKAQWPQTGRPERSAEQKRDDGEGPRRAGRPGGQGPGAYRDDGARGKPGGRAGGAPARGGRDGDRPPPGGSRPRPGGAGKGGGAPKRGGGAGKGGGKPGAKRGGGGGRRA